MPATPPRQTPSRMAGGPPRNRIPLDEPHRPSLPITPTNIPHRPDDRDGTAVLTGTAARASVRQERRQHSGAQLAARSAARPTKTRPNFSFAERQSRIQAHESPLPRRPFG